MKLGIVYKNGKIINHRSFIKVLLNPLLRYFGYQIVTQYCIETDTLGDAMIAKCLSTPNIRWENYEGEYDSIVKKRILI